MCKSTTDRPFLAARLASLLAATLGLGLLLSAPAVRADEASGGAAESAATAARASGSDEAVLLERARDYWDARGGRLGKVMEFYAPPDKGGPKQPKDVSEFGNVSYTEWKVEGVQVEGDRGIVEVHVTAGFRLPTPVKLRDDIWKRTIHEKWLKVEGAWYKEPIPLGFSGANDLPAAATAAGRKASAPVANTTAEGKGARP